MVEDVGGLEVSFLRAGRWTKAWDAALEEILPEAVRVTVTLSGGSSYTALAPHHDEIIF